MTEAVYPDKPLVPFIKVTQDRVVSGDSARMYPWLPFLSGGYGLPSSP